MFIVTLKDFNSNFYCKNIFHVFDEFLFNLNLYYYVYFL